MTVRVELYESLREAVGWHERDITVPEGSTAGGLFDQISGSFGSPKFTRDGVSVLAGLDYVDFEHVLVDGEKVSFLVENR